MSASASASVPTMRAFSSRGPADAHTIRDVPKAKIEREGDLLIEVYAVATNPVDVKAVYWKKNSDATAVGWDGSGVVVEVGPKAQGFQVGDEVYFSGDCSRAGSFAPFVAVDYKVVAPKPKTVSHAQAASLPLVGLTAYEVLHEELQVKAGDTVFIYGGTGGTGSIAIQLAKLAGCRVITTAGSEESKKWCESMGADVVIDYHKGIEAEWKKYQLEKVRLVYNTYSESELESIVKVVAPHGRIVLQNADADIRKEVLQQMWLVRMQLSVYLMCARAMTGFETEVQGGILRTLAQMVDEGKLKSIVTKETSGLESIEQLEKAHNKGGVKGKQVVVLKK